MYRVPWRSSNIARAARRWPRGRTEYLALRRGVSCVGPPALLAPYRDFYGIEKTSRFSRPDILNPPRARHCAPNQPRGWAFPNRARHADAQTIFTKRPMVWANLIIATGHNNAAMNARQQSQALLKGDQLTEGRSTASGCYSPYDRVSCSRCGGQCVHRQLLARLQKLRDDSE